MEVGIKQENISLFGKRYSKIFRKTLSRSKNKIWKIITLYIHDEKYLNFRPKKKLSCFRKSAGWKFFHYLPARIVACVSEYIFFVSNKKKNTRTHTQKQKAPETKEHRKTIETKKEKEKENVVIVNNICGKSNGMRWYRLTICSVYF